MKNPIGFFEMYVNNTERAKKFYESVFATNLEKMDDPTDPTIEMWSFPSDFSQYGASGAIVKRENCPAVRGSTIVYFSCEDCAVEESRIASAGGKIEQSKFSIGEYGFCVLAVDTEGNAFGLHSQK